MRSLVRSLALLTAALLAGCSVDQSGRVPLFEGLGDHHHAITTAAPEAQAYFDQGLRLTYAFNHAEAIRSYEQALELDPDVSDEERGYIDALAERYGPGPLTDRAARDSAYASAMSELAQHFPDDDDGQVLYADALMNLAPWVYWNDDATPRAPVPRNFSPRSNGWSNGPRSMPEPAISTSTRWRRSTPNEPCRARSVFQT